MTNKEVKSFLKQKRKITERRLNETSIKRNKTETEELKKEIDVINYILRKI